MVNAAENKNLGRKMRTHSIGDGKRSARRKRHLRIDHVLNEIFVSARQSRRGCFKLDPVAANNCINWLLVLHGLRDVEGQRRDLSIVLYA